MPWSKPKSGDPGQIGIVKMYQKYAGIPDQIYRRLLKEYTGCTSSTDARLTQQHFDDFMPVMELHAHLAHVNGRAVGKKPARIKDWYYWRKRQPRQGMANSRELHLIRKYWYRYVKTDAGSKYATHRQGESPEWYLNEIAAHAAGRYIACISLLRQREALMLIEALKWKLQRALAS